MVVIGRPLIDGGAEGPLLRLDEPISFWGGVDPESGRIVDPRQAQRGATIAGTVLALAATCGSSSSSAVMLELLARGCAPAAIILAEADAILALGIVVGREMGYPPIPVLELPLAEQRRFASGIRLRLEPGGRLSPA